MPDPVSITTGVIGLLASIVNISIKLNDLRSGFFEAKTEIDSFLRELGDLMNVLTRLQNSRALLRLPDNLSRDLIGVLKNCNNTAEEAEILLLDSSLRRFRGLFWVCTGKNEFLRLCRGLEAHKATIGIILNLSSLQASSEIWDKMDRFLSDIKDTHQLLPEKDFTLRRFLEDTETYVESIYEQSSATCVDDQYQQYQIDNDGDEFHYPTHPKGDATFTKINQVQSHTAFPPSQSQSCESTNIIPHGSANHQDKKIIRGRYKLLRTLPGHSSGVSSVVFSRDGSQLVSGSWDGTLRIWDLEKESTLQSLHGHGDDVTSVVFVGDESRLASASSDRTIRLWDVKTGSILRGLYGHSDRISSIACSNNSGQLASGSGDGTIRIWDVETGSNLQILRGDCGGVWSIALTDDGRQLVSGSGDGTISIWDIRAKSIVQSLEGHSDGVWSISLSRDKLASGSWDRTVMLWDLRTRSAAQILQGHDDRITSVVYVDEGRLASGSGDEKTIKLWDTKTGSVVQTLEADGGGISSIAFSAENGGQLASGSGDRTIRLWNEISSTR